MRSQPPAKLLNGCSSILEKYSSIIHHKISLNPSNDEYYNLSCREANIIKYNNNNYNVVFFEGSNRLGYHFALKFFITMLNPKKLNYILTDANLRVFYLDDHRSNLLFRAEFATNKTEQFHAQPHWQFEPYLIKTIKENDFDAILELRQYETEILDFNQESLNPLNISKIHFAMTSDWHKPKRDRISESHQVIIDNENVVNWLEGCLEYISNQIRLL